MLYTITGARRETGQTISFNLEAPSPDHATREANRNGIVVASVTIAVPDQNDPAPQTPLTPPPPAPYRPTRFIRAPRTRSPGNVAIDDFMMFRTMLTPWLVRATYWLTLLLNILFMFLWPVYVIRNYPAREHFSMMLAGEALAIFNLFATRILLELIIVIFRIHESLAELRLDLRTHR